MLPFEIFLFLLLILVTVVVLLLLIIVNILFKYKSVSTKAVVTKIEEKLKYKDSSISKQIAYDYVYQYYDFNKQKHYGKLEKNTPSKEFAVGEEIDVIYLKRLPHLSIYKLRCGVLPSLMWVVALILIILLLVFLKSYKVV